MKIKKKKVLYVLLAVAFAVSVILAGNVLQVVRYSVVSDKISKPVRIVFISDLHNCSYGGAAQSRIWKQIQAQEPDIVLFGGDVIDFMGDTKKALALMKMSAECFPCAYAAGNHEMMRSDHEEFCSEVEKLGIPVLHGSFSDISVNGQNIRVHGIISASEYSDQLFSCYGSISHVSCNILLAHQPEQISDITLERANFNAGFDIVLSGHAHGGQWRIPYLLEQGLYAPDQGILPDFTNGMRSCDGTVQIVSRGLAKPLRMFFVPRFFNRPELSVIDIVPN